MRARRCVAGLGSRFDPGWIHLHQHDQLSLTARAGVSQPRFRAASSRSRLAARHDGGEQASKAVVELPPPSKTRLLRQVMSDGP
jgi:hypothetical protein